VVNQKEYHAQKITGSQNGSVFVLQETKRMAFVQVYSDLLQEPDAIDILVY